MSSKRVMLRALDYARLIVPCPQCNGKKFLKNKGRCYRCRGIGNVPAPSTARK